MFNPLSYYLLALCLCCTLVATAQHNVEPIPAKPEKSSFNDDATYEKALYEWNKLYHPTLRSVYLNYQPDTIFNGYTDAQLKQMDDAAVRQIVGPSMYDLSAAGPQTTTTEKVEIEYQKHNEPFPSSDEEMKGISDTERERITQTHVVQPRPIALGHTNPVTGKHVYTKSELSQLPEDLLEEVTLHPNRFEIVD